MKAFRGDVNDSYAAINALRDAYHLREWIWKDRLVGDAALQTQIVGNRVKEVGWNTWVNATFSMFPLVRDICNGSKHFEPGAKVRSYSKAVSTGARPSTETSSSTKLASLFMTMRGSGSP